MKRRTLFQVLGAIFSGLLIRTEPVREAVKRRTAAFSPLARWRHVEPVSIVPATLKGDEAMVKGWPVKVAEVLFPARQTTRISDDDAYLAAMLQADGVEIVKGENVREIIDNNRTALLESERYHEIVELFPDNESWHPKS
jgi:hypothetical protein